MNRWIIRPNPTSTARLRLFCFPCAGGDIWLFQDWWRRLPREVDLCLVRLPGRAGRILERPFMTLPPLVSALAQALNQYQNIPFALFGHSMGALVAFELARYLRRNEKISPTHLFVAACRAPQLPAESPPIHNLPDALFVAELVRRYGEVGNMLQNRDLMRLVLPTVRADVSVCENYVHIGEPPLHCPIAAFGGIGDSVADPMSLEAWRWHTSVSFSLQLLRGNHFLMNSQSVLLGALAEHLDSYLSGPM
jgi:medium-chain acyl-[acyl-carrier-protein] hydrolase